MNEVNELLPLVDVILDAMYALNSTMQDNTGAFTVRKFEHSGRGEEGFETGDTCYAIEYRLGDHRRGEDYGHTYHEAIANAAESIREAIDKEIDTAKRSVSDWAKLRERLG